MDVTAPVRRWKGYGKPQRSELYLRWSLYLMALLQPPVALLVLVGTAPQHGPGPAGAATVLALSCGLCWLSIRAYGAAVDHYLGRPSAVDRRLRTTAGGALVAVWTTALISSGISPRTDGASLAVTVTGGLLVLWFGPLSVARPVRTVALQGLLGLALLAPPLLLAGADAATTGGMLVGLAVVLPLLGASCRSFAWLLGVVWELDAARETQSRLAVAEERLRFSRDLHDVMGRNLTTIALKSELAVQLARRGRPEAADQMTEVQRIAQESHREVRDLVRGYRTADLNAEVIGARAVLRAAGVECGIDLGEDAAELAGPVQSVLGWVLREATTNVLRHSEAGHCSVRLRLADGRAVLELENDGVPTGAPPARPGGRSTGGTGLRGLRERLAAHDGTLDLPPTAPGSFLLRASVPLGPGPAAGAPDPTALEATAR
ncbi:histidine kinase [Kitasatospora sp. NBC_00240]|uniref:sensor histidine kinase n=1 Tax=Kitasatospora sp. NBC_00240 TaxID=2903567 RepID=UPI00225AE933|nr:histidine kinase [Kitasatospora sp. NBC_00240]MCX5211810.1 histidine kinase [Kitasatospora sp. NBC_00240]